MRVHLGRTGLPDNRSCVSRFEQLITEQRDARHELTDDPAEAAIVLFTECHLLDDWRLTAIADSDVAREFPDKIFVYDERDTPWCRFPGIYVSLPKSGANKWAAAGSYYDVRGPDEVLDQHDADLLFSFVGSPTAPCRQAVFELRHEQAVVERVDGFTFYDPSSVDFAARQNRFRHILNSSKFVLCPRGTGTSSIRMYETCAAGRVPVIIADGWVEPPGPDWDSFSIRWPESAIAELPAYLTSIERLAEPMGRQARAAYERWFAPDVAITAQLDKLATLAAARPFLDFPAKGIRNAAWARAAQLNASQRMRQRLSPVKRAVLGGARGSGA